MALQLVVWKVTALGAAASPRQKTVKKQSTLKALIMLLLVSTAISSANAETPIIEALREATLKAVELVEQDNIDGAKAVMSAASGCETAKDAKQGPPHLELDTGKLVRYEAQLMQEGYVAQAHRVAEAVANCRPRSMERQVSREQDSKGIPKRTLRSRTVPIPSDQSKFLKSPKAELTVNPHGNAAVWLANCYSGCSLEHYVCFLSEAD